MAYIRYNVTVPAAGNKTKVPAAGLAVTVENVSVFGLPDHVPTMTFETAPEVHQPLYPQSIYNAAPCDDPRAEFAFLYIHGTTQSAGDVLHLLIHDEWAAQKIEPVHRRVLVGETTAVDVTDAAIFAIPSGELENSEGVPASAVLITFEGKTRVSFLADPVTAGGLGHLFDTGEQFYVQGQNFVEALKFIAEEAGGATINYSLEF